MTNERNFEFLLTLGKNIVCQRLFSVPNYNTKTFKSMNLYDEVKFICRDIENELKNKNAEYLLENANYFYSDDYNEKTDDNEEDFSLKINFGEVHVTERVFSSHYFHPKVRYSVDIRDKLKFMLRNLTEVLSMRTIETTYLGKKL